MFTYEELNEGPSTNIVEFINKYVYGMFYLTLLTNYDCLFLDYKKYNLSLGGVKTDVISLRIINYDNFLKEFTKELQNNFDKNEDIHFQIFSWNPQHLNLGFEFTIILKNIEIITNTFTFALNYDVHPYIRDVLYKIPGISKNKDYLINFCFSYELLYGSQIFNTKHILSNIQLENIVSKKGVSFNI